MSTINSLVAISSAIFQKIYVYFMFPDIVRNYFQNEVVSGKK